MTDVIYTGGCQCGAIRFRVAGVVKDSSICHCRMCQKLAPIMRRSSRRGG